MTTIDTGTEKMLAHVEDGVGWMTFNNPARHNAMSQEMIRAVPRILGAFGDDPDVKVVVVQGAGEKAFVSGADISEFSEQRTAEEARADYDKAQAESWGSWAKLEKPIIAMIRGYCIGGGLLTAMSADIRIASEGSQFGVPAAKLGLSYSFGGIETLMSLVGPSWAAEILFSARRLSAEEALHAGLVNRVVPVDALEAAVRELAAMMAANAPLTLRASKIAIREVLRDPERRDMDAAKRAIEACFASEDYLEGQASFAEKRPPRFRGV